MTKPYRVTVYRDSGRRWRWRAVAGNNRIVAASTQGYRYRWYANRKAAAAARQWPGATVTVHDA